MPMDIIGPLRLTGMNANGDFHVPLATTEAALVASYARGACAATKAGGIGTAVLYEGVMRTPAFVFENLLAAGQFVEWVVRHVDALKAAAEATTRHGKLVSLEPFIDNNVVFLICRYTTGDAAGQNMVTIATDALCHAIATDCPLRIEAWYVEGNFSGDKKASALGMVTGRGRKVSASVTLPPEIVEQVLGATVEDMLAYGRIANLGSLLSGQLGAQAHYANGLAAFYIATGQDAARRGKRGRHHADGGCGRRSALFGDDAQHPRRIGRRRHRPAKPVGCAEYSRPRRCGQRCGPGRGGRRHLPLRRSFHHRSHRGGRFSRAHESLARQR